MGHLTFSSVEERNKAVLAKSPTEVSSGVRNGLIAAILVGIAGYGLGFVQHDPIMFGVLLVNFMLLAGLTIAPVIAMAANTTVKAYWGRPVKNVALAALGFGPGLLVLLVLLMIGGSNIWEWTLPHEEIHIHGSKSFWLTPGFVYARQFLWLAILLGMGAVYAKKSRRLDAGVAAELDANWGEKEHIKKAAEGFTSLQQERDESEEFLKYWGPWMGGMYAVCFAMIGYDLVMSLEPHWFSTMFGGWMFMQGIQSAMAFLGIMAYTLRLKYNLEGVILPNTHHDFGKLTFGTSIFWAYLAFSQFIVIWYGNLPEETGYLIMRSTGAWQPVFIATFAMCFVIPFVVLVSKRMKMNATVYRTIATIILAGIWLNFYLLIVPAVLKYAQHHGIEIANAPTITPAAIMVTIGSIAAFVLVLLTQLAKYPLAPIGDERLQMEQPHI